MNCFNMAIELVRAGKSVIPISPRDKRPYVPVLPLKWNQDGSPDLNKDGKQKRSWEEFQTRIATEDEVAAWFNAEPRLNIGLVCGSISGVIAVDVDGEQGREWFRANMPKPNVFQYTSSKSKFHAFYAHPGHNVPPAVRMAPEVDVRGDGSYVVFAPSTHKSGAVYTLHFLKGFDGWGSLVPCPDLEQFKVKKAQPVQECFGHSGSLDIDEGGRNQTLTQLVARIAGKNLSLDEAMCFAHGWNMTHCRPPLPESELRRTVESMFQTHSNRNPLAINADGIRKWALAIPGEFRVQDLDSDLGIKEKEDRLQRTATLEAMCRTGELERVGSARNTYRVRDRKLNVIDLDAPEAPEFELWLPFGLNRNVKVHQKNIIIIAGETNAGKTSLMFNMAWMQSQRSRVRYACSEMNGPELTEKMQSFGTREQWQNCEFIERTSGFHDVVVPDGVTFIDYLEVYDNFFRIGEDIRKIYDALTTGVAIIAMQKAQGADLGRGGAFTIEKARLAISLFSHGKMLDGIIGSAKVVKAKNVRRGWNPEGREIFYTLRNGYYFDANDVPQNIHGLQRGWWFYDKKEHIKVCDRITAHCRAYETNEGMQNVEFYG